MNEAKRDPNAEFRAAIRKMFVALDDTVHLPDRLLALDECIPLVEKIEATLVMLRDTPTLRLSRDHAYNLKQQLATLQREVPA